MPGNVPATVFRYMSAEGLVATLKQRQLRLTSPAKFNDPFDCRWNLAWQMGNREWIDRLVARHADLIVRGAVRRSDFANSEAYKMFFELRQAALKEQGPEEAARNVIGYALTHNLGQRQREQMRRIRQLGTDFRVLSCSTLPDCPLMWGHYAKSHEGFLVELRPEKVPLGKNAVCAAVEYARDLPKVFDEEEAVQLFVFGQEMDPRKALRIWAFTKSEHWSYEREVRLLVFVEGAADPYYFAPLEPGAVVSVSAGACCSKRTRDEAFGLCSVFDPAITCWQAQIHPSQFALRAHGERISGGNGNSGAASSSNANSSR
jgi:hypothetical protein